MSELSLPNESSPEALRYQQAIDGVLSRRVTPKSIDSYADEALADLIEIIDDMVAGCHDGALYETGLEAERAAFSHYGLKPKALESTLDHIANLSASISGIDAFIERRTLSSSTIITPPEEGDFLIRGDGPHLERAMIPRLKTTLVLLKHEFGIDIEDESQLNLIPGVVTDDMVRKTPYHLLDIPALNRVVNVCDEQYNRTFIFDKQKLQDSDIDMEKLAGMNKSQLKMLIERTSGVGASMVYGPGFVSVLAQYLRGSLVAEPAEDAEAITLLKPKAELRTEGRMTAREMAEYFGIDKANILTWLKEQGIEPVMQKPYLKAKQNIPTYDAGLLQEIASDSKIRKLADTKPAPEGVDSFRSVAEEIGVSEITLTKYATKSHMPVGDYRFGTRSRVGRGLWPHDVEYLRHQLAQQGHFAEPVREGEHAIYLARKKIHCGGPAFQAAVERLEMEDPEFGELVWRQGEKKPFLAVNDNQIEKIRQYLARK